MALITRSLQFLLRRRRTGADAPPADHLAAELAVSEPGHSFYYGYGVAADGESAASSHLLFRADGTRLWHDTVGAADGSTVFQGDGSALTGIIDSGSNANGFWTRYADGTQICWIAALTLTYVNSVRVEATWTFPAAFSGQPAVMAIADAGDLFSSATPDGPDVSGVSYANRSASSVDLRLIRVEGRTDFEPGDTCVVSAEAKGRWA